MVSKKKNSGGSSLNPDLARSFVFGDDSAENDKPLEPQSQGATPGGAASLVQRLSSQDKEPTVRLTVDLSASLHRKLSLLAAKTGQKKAAIVRLLLNDALNDIE